MKNEEHPIRAAFTAETITVYQAYGPQIALPALRAGRFVEPFKRERMTWIKPSFLWMMYRSGWATKPDQEHVLAVEITQAGFEWALAHACLSHFDPHRHADRDTWARQLNDSPVRVQWDPERSLRLERLPQRSLQIGLSGKAVDHYLDDWTVSLTDVTELAHSVRDLVQAQDDVGAAALLPHEEPYILPADIATRIDATASSM